MMNKELEELYAELEKVKSSHDEYLPEYGYSSKEEIIQLINEDIAEVKEKMNMNLKLCASRISIGYTDKSLEEERTHLCVSQGLARYC
ncbi:hypothetical protein [uncultured Bacteroides sp.]|uniref:hypothetical protein n=1 Tax=uncultured Bacteroides sp. TaxID=162156 RepID=UPI002620EFAE|nr:hypothetical protein [uncultured Bacteroides sp.]